MSVPEELTMEHVAPGMELGEVVYGPLDREDFIRYASASGDFNPIHTDEDYAHSTGAPAVFAMGMLVAGHLGHALSDWFGGPQHLRRYKMRFTTRVWPGDEIVCMGRVDDIEDGILKVRLEAHRRGQGPAALDLPAEELVIVAEADVELPE